MYKVKRTVKYLFLCCQSFNAMENMSPVGNTSYAINTSENPSVVVPYENKRINKAQISCMEKCDKECEKLVFHPYCKPFIYFACFAACASFLLILICTTGHC